MRNRSLRSASRIAPKTLGESNRGQQNQSIVPSVPTSATVCRSPITPWSAIGRYSAIAQANLLRRSRLRSVDLSTIDELEGALRDASYLPDRGLATALFLA